MDPGTTLPPYKQVRFGRSEMLQTWFSLPVLLTFLTIWEIFQLFSHHSATAA